MKRYWIAVPVILGILALLVVFWIRAPQPQVPAPPVAEGVPVADEADEGVGKTYHSKTYGFSFRYPDTLDIEEYLASTIAVGSPIPNGFESAVEVAVGEDHAGTADYDTFVDEWMELLCAADGPDRSTSCDGIEARESFTTASGLAGDRYALRLVRTDVLAGTRTVSSFGPVYAFKLRGDPADFTTVFVYAPLATYDQGPDRSLVSALAESLAHTAGE